MQLYKIVRCFPNKNIEILTGLTLKDAISLNSKPIMRDRNGILVWFDAIIETNKIGKVKICRI